MTVQSPFASRELRWFFEGPLPAHPDLEEWFFGCAPFAKAAGLEPPAWLARRDDIPDVYLLLPGQEDMGIKWREGLLQIKGLVESLGEHEFCGKHVGTVERWIKWSYADLPEGYAELFDSPAVSTVAVRKLRAVRLLDLASAEPVEVRPDTDLELGMAVELAKVDIAGTGYCSLGFEAFPDHRLPAQRFGTVAEAFLRTLDALALTADRSQSYAAWLNRLERGRFEV